MLFGCGSYQADQPLEYGDKGYTNCFPDEMFPGTSDLKLNQIYQQKHTIYSELIFDEYGNTFFESGNSESEIEDFKCKLTCFNLEKKEVVWEYDFIGLKVAGNLPVYNKGKIFQPTAKSLTCLSSSNGEILWEHEYPDNSYAFWGSFNDKLYVLFEKKSLQCLDENNGNLIWSVPVDAKFWYSDYVISDNKTFLCHMNLDRTTIFAYDLSNGKKLFEYTPDSKILLMSYKNEIIFLMNEKSIVAYDINANVPRWILNKFNQSFIISKNEISISDKYIFCRSNKSFSDDNNKYKPGVFYCIEINTGNIIWQNYEILSRDVLFCNNYIYHRLFGYEIYISNAENGKTVWQTNYDVAKDESIKIRFMTIYKNRMYAIGHKTAKNAKPRGEDFYKLFEYSKD